MIKKFIILFFILINIIASAQLIEDEQTTYGIRSFVYKEENGEIIRGIISESEKKEIKKERIAALKLSFETTLPIGADPNNYNPQSFAEWQYYYEQIDLWEKYVSQELFKEELNKKTTFEPRVAIDEIKQLVESHKNQANNLSLKDYQKIVSILRGIEKRETGRQQRQTWLTNRSSEMDDFAINFTRRLNGELITVNGQDFLVTNEPQTKCPTNAIPVVTKVLTPYDLLNRDGTMRKK